MILEVNNIFCSIQGESTYIGLPFVFIRLSGCNLRCSYCDTKYAYYEGTNMKLAGVLAQVNEYPYGRVEITGGEPLIQEDTNKLIAQLLEQNYKILLETNGSKLLNNIPQQVIKIVDVKTPGSGESGSFRENNLSYINEKDNLKFVLTDRADFEWSKKFIEKFNLNNKCEILFSAASEELEYSELAEWILKAELDVRFQPQLHKIIWPNDYKGV